MAGEASSIVQAPGGDTLRRNFQQIQEGRTLTQEVTPQPPAAKEKPSGRAQRDIPEPGPPARPAIPHRLIGAFDSVSLIVINYPSFSYKIVTNAVDCNNESILSNVT